MFEFFLFKMVLKTGSTGMVSRVKWNDGPHIQASRQVLSCVWWQSCGVIKNVIMEVIYLCLPVQPNFVDKWSASRGI